MGLPKIPVHPIGYHDAIHLLKLVFYFLKNANLLIGWMEDGWIDLFLPFKKHTEIYAHFNRNMGGQTPPNNWKGALNVSYRTGPGFISDYKNQ